MAKTAPVIDVCRLCEKTRELHRSHVIPEFCYVGYDHLHRLIEIHRHRPRSRFIQKGFREPLLCHTCEQLLNDRYEKPMKAAWFDNPKLPPLVSSGELLITGLDYAAFKLFHLSVLWRATVAVDGEYGPVRLPPRDAANMRRMVFEGDPGLSTQYPVLGLALLLPPDGAPAFGLIQSTSYEVIERQSVYRTVYGACAWQIWVGSRSPRPELALYGLTEAGSLLLPAVDVRQFGPIGSVWESYRRHATVNKGPDLSS